MLVSVVQHPRAVVPDHGSGVSRKGTRLLDFHAWKESGQNVPEVYVNSGCVAESDGTNAGTATAASTGRTTKWMIVTK